MPTPSFASDKLRGLLTQLWASPVFRDSYPATVGDAHPSVLRTIDQVYEGCLRTVDHVLALAWPNQRPADRAPIAHQVVAKSVAFCGALAAGEVTDVERLRAAATAIAIVSWADQTMDRGDAAMITAVELVAGGYTSGARTPAVQHYIAALGWFVREVAVLARPEDALWILRCLLPDTLLREARMRRLSMQYLSVDADGFWDDHAGEIGELVVDNVGFIAVTAMVYAVYRHHDPSLPCLTEVLSSEPLQEGLLRAGGAAIRALDDIGDRAIDAGNDLRWGAFALNLCNQSDPRHISAFLDAANIRERAAFVAAWSRRDYQQLTQLWLDHVRDAYRAIPHAVREQYGTFVTLARRVIEAGLVNALGDDILAEETRERAVSA